MSNRKIVRKDSNLILARNTWSETEAKLLASFITELKPLVSNKLSKEEIEELKDKKELTEQEQQILNEVKEYNEIEFPQTTITIDELSKLWKCKLNTTQIDNICIDLKTKSYIIPGKNENGNPIRMYRSLFDKIDYHLLEKKITFKFHDDMKPYLLKFAKQFVKYNIENILRFKNKYSISFYEYFKLQTQFKKEPMITEVIKVEELREWLDLNANKHNKMKKDKYTRMYDIKVHILDKVKTDLQRYSDVYMSYDFIKTYRTVTHIKFNFTKNNTETQQTFFTDDELETAYDKYINKQYKNKDGDVCTIKQIKSALTDSHYIEVIVFNEFAQANQEVKLSKEALKNLK